MNPYKTGETPRLMDVVIFDGLDSAKCQMERTPTITVVAELDTEGQGAWVLTRDGRHRQYVDTSKFRLVHRADVGIHLRAQPLPTPATDDSCEMGGVPEYGQPVRQIHTVPMPGGSRESGGGGYIIVALLEDGSLWELRPAGVEDVAWKRIATPRETVNAFDRP